MLNIISNTNKYLRIVFFMMIVTGITVRFSGISNTPAGINQDEASIGYEAFSILKTGLDRNSISFPIHLISWGSGQNALYAYLTIPFVAVFGMNAFSVRIVNVIFGCISLIVFYSLFKLVFDKKKALVALAMLSICPWSIMSSRWGLESNIFPTLILLSIFFLLKSIYTSKKYLVLSFFFFSISLYSYGTSYLLVPLYFIFTIPILLKKGKIDLKHTIYSFLFFVIISLPIVLFVIINHLNLAQIQFSTITIPRLDSNRTTVIFNLFTSNFFEELIKNFVRFFNTIILQSDGNDYNAIPIFGTIYHLSFPFLIIGLYDVIRNRKYKEIHHFIFCTWLLCSIILGITSNTNINRLNIIFFPILYFVVHGIFLVESMLKPEFGVKYKMLLTCLYSILFASFISYYFVEFHLRNNSIFSSGLGDAIQYAEKLNPSDTILISNRFVNMPYIYVCFYNQVEPNLFRKTVHYKDKNYSNGFREVESLGRYIFNNKPSLNKICIMSREDMKFNNDKSTILKEFGNYTVVKFGEKN